MTICAPEDATAPVSTHRAALTIAADGSYAARLARHDDAAGSWFPERWTLSGPEPYAVPLQGTQPEEPDSALLPLTDGRVLILRRVADRFAASLLYPAGPGTGELLLGAVPAPELTLLPPAPDGKRAYALAPEAHHTALWLLHGGAGGPERIARISGRCTGGVWLDRGGRLLALDRERDGRTKTVVADLERGGETGPLLQITEESNDRLLLADPDSGLLLVRSDAPGHDRLGWGVWGSSRPVRFPECLRPAEGTLTPFAVQPGQTLAPESCAVAFRMETANGTWPAVWRPAERQVRHLPAPEGWLAGSGLWTAAGALLLPYATGAEPCGLAWVAGPGRGAEPVEPAEALESVEPVESVNPVEPPRAVEARRPAGPMPPARPAGAMPMPQPLPLPLPADPPRAAGAPRPAGPAPSPRPLDVPAQPLRGAPCGAGAGSGGGIALDAGVADNHSTASAHPPARSAEPRHLPAHPHIRRPVPLQQAPLAAR
ncbi:hypothetical protein [Streptomyces angustmyceticus]|uniref:hypothetical protein n=1 Tax=Streptomyces angustmyceticus TaxID=285578 RepID=UPI0021AFCBF1|nr:hypothetical protein [Streptomyces angustmyceticus]